jgi:MYXO-CTERM domain-containing protein
MLLMGSAQAAAGTQSIGPANHCSSRVVATGDVDGRTTTVVPEPAAVLLGALGVLTLLRRRRVVHH